MFIMVDRDGVLNEVVHGGYVTRWQDFRWIKNSREALGRLRAAAADLAIVTNQAAIGKGLATDQGIEEIHRRMLASVSPPTLRLQDIYVCPHLEEDKCDCRKPRPGLLLKALRDHHQDPSRSLMIGDTWRDAQAAAEAGVPFFLVYTGMGRLEQSRIRSEGVPCLGVFDDLLAAAAYLIGKE